VQLALDVIVAVNTSGCPVCGGLGEAVRASEAVACVTTSAALAVNPEQLKLVPVHVAVTVYVPAAGAVSVVEAVVDVRLLAVPVNVALAVVAVPPTVGVSVYVTVPEGPVVPLVTFAVIVDDNVTVPPVPTREGETVSVIEGVTVVAAALTVTEAAAALVLAS
jgi:hypothetical protein